MKIQTKLLLALGAISIFPPIAAYVVLIENPQVSFALRMNEYEAQQRNLAAHLQSDVRAMASAFEESLSETYRIQLDPLQSEDPERQRKLANAALQSAVAAFEADLNAMVQSEAEQGKEISANGSSANVSQPGLESEQQEAQIAAELLDSLRKVKSDSKEFIRLSDTFSPREGPFVQEVLEPATKITLDRIQKLENVTDQESAEDRRNIETASKKSYQQSMLVASLGLGVSFFLAFVMSRVITRPIHALRDASKNIARGMMDTRVRVHSADELGELAACFNFMADNLRNLMKEVVFKNALFEAQAENTIDGILAVDENDRIILSNHRFAAIFDVPSELIRAGDNAPVLQRVLSTVENSQQFLEKVQHLYSHREESSKDEIRLKDGRVLDRFSSPLFDPKGSYYGRIWYHRDMTERFKAQENLQLWSRVLDQSAEGIFVCDPQERILLVNKSFEFLTGYSAEEAIGKTPRLLRSGRQDRVFYMEMWKSLREKGVWRGEMWNRRKSGEIFAEWQSISAVCDSAGAVTHYVGIFSDITARKRDQERMVYLAQYDALTDLPNRALLLDRLNQLIATAERRQSKLGVMFIDLDRFKEVNDSLGHDAGDTLLKTVAKRLSSSVRKQDTVARMGGDEFVVLVHGFDDEKNVAVIARTLLSHLTEPITINGYELGVSASIGISVYPNDSVDALELIRNADAAMYQAKSAGRNAFHFYTSDLNQRALEMLSTENALRRAIERSEFVLHYQPLVDIHTGSLVGAEALIRWNHPEMGLVMPAKFIPVAEERGLIVPIGNWVIEEATRQAAAWRSSMKWSLPIAVNVSAVQFRQKDFIDHLLNCVHKYGVDPSCLQLELTESIVMRDAKATIEILKKLHQIGFQLSIDDFGTGYSSLSYLRDFPIHKIKIDRSFVADASAADIISAVVGLGRSLKIKIIAEGVQTTEQLELLRNLRCDEAQGFLFSHALPSNDFEKLVREWSATNWARKSLPSSNPKAATQST